jgi:chaperonin GroES
MIKLLKNQVAVEPIHDPDFNNTTTRLIKIPDFAKERSDQGIVKYLGEDTDPEIQIGDHVIFSGYTGTTIMIDKELLIIMHSDFIKAKIDIDTYPVPGLYFKGRVGSEEIEIAVKHAFHTARTHEIASEIILKAIAIYLNEILIPATYESILPQLASSYKHFIGSRIDIKKERYLEQKDPYDERRK